MKQISIKIIHNYQITHFSIQEYIDDCYCHSSRI